MSVYWSVPRDSGLIPVPAPLGNDVPWYDAPITWPLSARLLFGGAILVGVFGIIRFATKEG